MRKVMNEEEALFHKEGRGRFNLRRSCEITKLPRRSKTGPKARITNRPTRDLVMPTMDRQKLVPALQKDAMGNDVRVYVVKKRRRK